MEIKEYKVADGGIFIPEKEIDRIKSEMENDLKRMRVVNMGPVCWSVYGRIGFCEKLLELIRK